jgi:carbamoyl-phosphate synthase large subunit
MNILLIGAGRRVCFSRYFINDNLFSYESTQIVPISKVASVIIGKRWSDANIYDDIIEIYKSKKIDLVIPLMDAATTICSKIKKDINCPTSSADVNEICLNKKLFEKFMVKNFPKFYPSFDDISEIVAKPSHGFGSNGVRYFTNIKNYVLNPDDIVQRKIEGTEYSVDCYFDKESKMIDSVPRTRIRVAAGEVISSATKDVQILRSITKEIGENLRLIGPCCFQYMIDKNDNPFLFEINARFGGGCTLSIHAGFDIPNLIKRDYNGLSFEYTPDKWKRNVIMERYNEDTFYET